jgi:hypothetical protein
MLETLHRDFAVLTGKNRKNVLDMTRFLVLAQNELIPSILNGNEGTADSGAMIKKRLTAGS